MGSNKFKRSITQRDIDELAKICNGKIKTHVPLNKVSRWKIGGLADVVVTPESVEEVISLRQYIYNNGLDSVVIGSTSNLLFSDAGLKAIMIHVTNNFGKVSINERFVVAEGGAWVPGLARKAMLAGLSGLEHTCGIPGTIGGLICMNGGSQRRGIGEVTLTVESVDEKGSVIKRSKEECGFKYRTSIYQKQNEIITKVKLALTPSSSIEGSRAAILKILRDRREKFPQKLPNCGSTFVSNPSMYEDFGPPGKIIEDLGLKGYKIGSAEVSTQHANFIINNGNATAEDTLKLIRIVQELVHKKTGYKMEVEARYVDSNGTINVI